MKTSYSRKASLLLGIALTGSLATVLATIFNINPYYSPVTGVTNGVDRVVLTTAAQSYNLTDFPTRGSFAVTVYEAGVTPVTSGQGLVVEIGFGSTTTSPTTWTDWVPATFVTDWTGGTDIYQALPPSLPQGNYGVVARARLAGQSTYTYGDRDGSQNNVDTNQYATLTVGPCGNMSASIVSSGVDSIWGTAVPLTADITAGTEYGTKDVRFQYRTTVGTGPWTDLVPVLGTTNPDTTAPFNVLFDATAIGAGTVEFRALATNLCDVADSSVGSVAYTLTPTSPDLTGGIVGGNFVQSGPLDNTTGEIIRTADPDSGFATGIVLSNGALPNPTGTITIEHVDGTAGANFTVASQNLEAIGSNLRIDVTSNAAPVTDFASNPLTFFFDYPDVDNDGIVDGTTIAETALNLYYYNTGTSAWEIGGTVLNRDTVGNQVSFTVTHLTEFGLFGEPNSSQTDWQEFAK